MLPESDWACVLIVDTRGDCVGTICHATSLQSFFTSNSPFMEWFLPPNVMAFVHQFTWGVACSQNCQLVISPPVRGDAYPLDESHTIHWTTTCWFLFLLLLSYHMFPQYYRCSIPAIVGPIPVRKTFLLCALKLSLLLVIWGSTTYYQQWVDEDINKGTK